MPHMGAINFFRNWLLNQPTQYFDEPLVSEPSPQLDFTFSLGRSRVKPPTAHISRVVIEEDGEELQIVRHSFPYDTISEAGLFFIAYTKDLSIPANMLSRMMSTTGDGKHDHLMDFTRAVSGATFFAPSPQVLRGRRPR
jgi:deferrochelatase/peroxidase EfeB